MKKTTMAIWCCAALAGCGGASEVTTAATNKSAPTTTTATSVPGMPGLAIELEAGDAADASDPSVAADLAQLVPDLRGLPSAIATRGGAQKIVVRYRGKGRLGKPSATPEAPRAAREVTPTDDEVASFTAFNLATRNEFEVRIPRGVIAGLHAAAEATGLNRGVQLDPSGASPSGGGRGPVETSARAGDNVETSDAWSNYIDNRARFYNVNAAVTAWERQRVSDFGGCTVTLIGPRHVITAAHCLYDPDKADPWTDDVSIRVARNGTSWLDSVVIDNDNIPSGQVLWYWVPSGWINSQHHQYDIGIVVTPKRIGETTGGWMGWWVLDANTLATQSLWNVGYPACVATTSDGTARIDEPNPCSENHLYGDVYTCAPATYTNTDGDGWNRNFQHRCDASGGQSGSPIYLNYNGNGWGVTGVHIQSLCGATANDPCSATESIRPLRATRITPEYSGWISYFRNLYP